MHLSFQGDVFFIHLLPCPLDLFLPLFLSFQSLAKTLHGISWLSWFKSFLDLIDLMSTTSVPYGVDWLEIPLQCHELAVNAAGSSESDGLHQRKKIQLFFSLPNM